LAAALPEDFNGLPLVNPQRSWYMLYKKNRQPEHIPLLWRFFETMFGLSSADDLDTELFDQCCEIPGVKPTNLTMGMFWIRPDLFFALDRKNLSKAESLGLEKKPQDGMEYLDWMRRLRESYTGEIASFSYDAHLSAVESPLAFPYSRLFRDAGHAEEVLDVFVAALKSMGYPDKQPNDKFLSFTIRKKSPRHFILRVNCGPWAAFSFRSRSGVYAYEVIVPEDHPLCDLSKNELLKETIEGKRYGWANIPELEVERFWPDIEPSLRTVGNHFRGQISNYRKPYQQTLLELITLPDSRERILGETLLLNEANEPDPVDSGYWWISVEPTEFTFKELAAGKTVRLEANNAAGLRRSIADAFDSAKPGDTALIYIRAPQRFVWGSARVISGLEGGEHLELQIETVLDNPILLESFSEHPELADCKALTFRKGTLCRLQEEEYEIIAGDAFPKEESSSNLGPPAGISRQYSMQEALSDLFVDEERLQLFLSLLRRKKNIVLQGAPGTGKTFIARRLAYLLLGEKDESRVATTQFHPTTSYEDFVQGFRPDENGGFQLRNGMFYKFCRQAQAQPNKLHVFIIDEINRGNLAKILGELMLLIEADKRSLEYAVPLTYSGDTSETFYVPDNVYLIGTMNTADRSLSLVDYALRRRFSFVELIPGFDSPRFDSVLADKGVSAETILKLKSRMASLNALIASDERSLGRGFCIGHSFFVPNEKIVDGTAWLREVMEYEIVPLLEEYCVDEPTKLADALAIARGQR
jgi:hypothetical protein